MRGFVRLWSSAAIPAQASADAEGEGSDPIAVEVRALDRLRGRHREPRRGVAIQKIAGRPWSEHRPHHRPSDGPPPARREGGSAATAGACHRRPLQKRRGTGAAG